MVKFVVDLKKRLIGAGGELQVDAEKILLERGSAQSDLWGANYYLDNPEESHLEYTSMINIRPRDGNGKIKIESAEIQEKVKDLALYFFEGRT